MRKTRPLAKVEEFERELLAGISVRYTCTSSIADTSVTIHEGKRFSSNYITRGEPTSDSERMRLRVSRLFSKCRANSSFGAEEIESALGVSVPRYTTGYCHWDRFFTRCALRDFLDTITVVAKALRDERSHRHLQDWIEGVSLIFSEENVRDRLDPLGGVHFAVDGEFEHNQACAIAALQPARYGAARSHFEAGQRALDANPPETREAIRQTFECVETIFKLMFPDVSQLGSSEITKKLQPLLDSKPQGTERNALLRWLAGFKEWVNGAHQYRHGQGVEEPDNPSVATAVLSVSLGSTYARWLAELNAATIASAG